ncbi:HTH domain-containing protein [Macrococcoides goetzii]|uniref:HTH domain-containing protein n=1 Tax=Macrococcoides goetzii TaxID=1891097 RepID=A0A395GAL9_9STAP|nr:HTH domain-containing protein [Macrococcus goetzii]RAI81040.1 HTH domain-containing protein [Macrococcus goetzii]
MNKAQRLLTIYTRLLNNQGVNKMNLADELEVDERTIQRDIDDIRNYLFDNDEYQQRMEVTYQHKTNEYRLIRHNTLLDSNILSILIMHLKNHSSVISRDMYELLKSIIYKFYSHDTKHLLEQINMFHVVDEEKNTLTVLSILQEAIHQQNTIKFKYHGEEIVGNPVQITSTHNQYKLWLKKNNRQFRIKNIKSLQTTDAEISNPEKVMQFHLYPFHICRL